MSETQNVKVDATPRPGEFPPSERRLLYFVLITVAIATAYAVVEGFFGG